jgi:hypothetical protein
MFSTSPGQTSVRTIALGVVLGIAATFLTYNQSPGLGLTLFSFLLIAVLFVFARIQQVRPARRNMFLVVPVLFFGAMLTIRSNADLTLLNIGAWIAAALLFVHFFASGNAAQQNIFAYPLTAMVAGTVIWLRPFLELANARKWLAERKANWAALAPIARGAAITVPVVGVFVVLFSSADEVFGRMVTNLFETLIPTNVYSLAMQGFYAGMFAWPAIGGLAYALLDRKVKRAPTRPIHEPASAPADTSADLDGPSMDELVGKTMPKMISLGFTEVTMLLGSVCFVFAAFVAVQFVYLFGGARNLASFNYAEYVHRGFAELVAVAVLTLGLVYVLNAVALRRSSRQINVFRGLSTLLIVLTGVILVSAFQRLRLYEMAYGFTTLRLTIYVTIVWLGVLFAGFALSLYWVPLTINVFSLTVLIAAFGFVGTLDVLNPDAFVAQQIVNRGDIDPLYLATLSEEAVPVLVKLVDAPEPGLRTIVRDRLAFFNNRLKLPADWRAFNLAENNARAALDSIEAKLQNYTREYTITLHKLDDLKAFLKQGMTLRQVTRQLGMPYYGGDSVYSFEGNYRGSNATTLTYQLNDKRLINLAFHTSDGLTGACIYDYSAKAKEPECLSLSR